MPRSKRVIVVTHGQGRFGHDAALGIVKFGAKAGWDILLELGGANPLIHRSVHLGIRDWKADAIVGELQSPPMLSDIRQSGIPAVNISRQKPTDLPTVCCDHMAVGVMAAHHLIERHFRSFAFCGWAGCLYSSIQEQAYRATLAESGFGCASYPPLKPQTRTWLEEHKDIQQWIRRLPRPVAILACDDIRGRDVLLACERLRSRVPDDMSVLGSVNDILLCTTCQPPLASIAIASEEIGYRAAQLAQRLMAGSAPPAAPLLVAPLGIVMRRSLDFLAVDDADVVAAEKYIRDHCSKPYVIRDLAGALQISRRSLERKFRKVLGRTPQEEILRSRLQEAQNLLSQNSMKISAIGQAAGFSGYLQFIRCFRRKFGVTPTEYRARFVRGSFPDGH